MAPVSDDLDLPTGVERARAHAEALPRLWQLTGRPGSRAAIDDAVDCAGQRAGAHDDRSAVLVHGDVHDGHALAAGDGTFKLIDPGGLRAEPACDLGAILRCNPDAGDDLSARAERLALRTGVDAIAIWEWGTISRAIGGLHSLRVGFQPFGDQLLANADRLSQADDRSAVATTAAPPALERRMDAAPVLLIRSRRPVQLSLRNTN